MTTKNKFILALIIIAVFDAIIPIPFMAIMLIYVVLEKPVWFKQYVDDIYNS
ncbi:MAG: hypothetical protein KDF60_18830 [Calditrichaeota bacterium]|nr:hypothetical protein [Calditrichota bacterium]